MKHFVNDRDAIVEEAIEGMILAAGVGRLCRLDGDPSIRVVLRAERDEARVAVISGGGSGHEPGHAGFVGDGLLDAAVCGDIFASPSVDAVLAAILAVTGPAGCLLIVKNYAGDRLNFGLAAERARALGLEVAMVVVGDDVALVDNPRPRGIAGTVFVHKAAGHAAQAGQSLAEVRAAAEAVARSVRSLGIATTSCSIPGRASEDRIAAGQAELGLGIHGEPGIERIALPSAADLVATMMARFGDDILAAPRLALLVNNLGGVPALEMAVVTREILVTAIGRRVELILGPAPVITALDMRGFSISLLPLDDARAAMLTTPVDVAAWPVPRRPAAAVAGRPMPAAVTRDIDPPSADPATRVVLTTVCDALIAAEVDLDRLDARVGDGDTGSTFATAARRIRGDLDLMPLADPARLARALSDRLSRVMGGSSGVLMSIFAAATGVALSAGTDLPQALAAGLDRMRHYGGAAPGDRTMVDALAPAIAVLEAGGDLAAAAAAARAGATATASMAEARAGRSSYLAGADLAGVVDPGAEAVARILEALAVAQAEPGHA
jgi:dihydroxyacetone kinase